MDELQRQPNEFRGLSGSDVMNIGLIDVGLKERRYTF